MNAYYRELSYDQISLTGKLSPDGDVFGWYTLNDPSAPACDRNAFSVMADQEAARHGVSLAGYDHIIYVFNWAPECEDLAFSAGKVIKKFYVGGNFFIQDFTTYIHELGHNLGLMHAESANCQGPTGAPVAISGNCTLRSSNRDRFDPMGFGKFQPFSNWRREQLGILPPTNAHTVAEPGIFSLHAALHPTTKTTSLRIPRTVDANGTILDWYDLEIREAGSIFDSWFQELGPSNFYLHNAQALRNAQKGVLIRIVSGRDFLNVTPSLKINGRMTVLLDTAPETSDFLDAPLGVGRVVNLETEGIGGPGNHHVIRVETLTAGDGKATVSIAFPDIQPPTKPSNPSASLAPAGVSLTWAASTDNVGVVRYRVLRDGKEIGTAVGASFIDAHAPAGVRSYTVYAEDQAGNRSLSSSAVQIDAPDSDPPTKPSNPSASLTLAGVRIGWMPSTDNVGVVRYRVLRDGKEIGTAVGASFIDAHAPVGMRSYTVYAEDRAGNRSLSSSAVQIDAPDSDPPTRPSNLSASLTPVGIRIGWTPSTDNVGVVRYRVSRGGKELGTAVGTNFLDTTAWPGRHTYVLQAEDEAGNSSDVSSPLQVIVQASGQSDSAVGLIARSQSSPGNSASSNLSIRLRWHRRQNGSVVFRVLSSGELAITRVGLWIDGDLIKVQRSLPFRVVWSPGKKKTCRRRYLAVARIIGSGDREAVTVSRVPVIRDHERRGSCRS